MFVGSELHRASGGCSLPSGGKDIVYTAGFHNRPMIHDDDPVTERTDDAEVV